MRVLQLPSFSSLASLPKEDLRAVLAPYTPEQLHLSFLDAQSYLDSVEERGEDPELADELLERSGYAQFIDTLNVSSALNLLLYTLFPGCGPIPG